MWWTASSSARTAWRPNASPTSTPPQSFSLRSAARGSGRAFCEAEFVSCAADPSVEQADLAQDRDRVRVDVLALDQAVLEWDHVDAVPADRATSRRRL